MDTKIVVDTSVLISALIGKEGPGRSVLRKCLMHECTPLISNPLFSEYEDVSSRKDIIELCPLSREEIRELTKSFYKVCKWVPIYYLWRPNLIDEGDNFLIELAVAGNADFIITNNIKDLKGAELSFKSFEILTPELFLGGH
ncbi:putative toxin-antitoxin system toxin component, PIN family [Oleiphilus messinensis]|nr:putative toxin-antitoxin system toxin component, PIN family [Oleiphilus messinensis]